MPGLCGLIGPEKGDAYYENALTGMLSGLFHRPGEKPSRHVFSWGAFASLGKEGSKLYMSADLLVMLSGDVYWAGDEGRTPGAERAGELAQKYRQKGRACLFDLRGTFSLCIVDIENRTVLNAIDRAGIASISYTNLPGGGFAFASTADALVALDGVAPVVDMSGIYRYAMNFVSPAPYSIYRSISKLLPAHSVRADSQGKSVEVQRYWLPQYTGAAKWPASKARAYEDRLMDVLEKAVSRAVTDPPDSAAIGAFLSGGLDSSTVCGLLAKITGGHSLAYTITFEDQAYDEGPYARLAAKHFGLHHKEYCLKPAEVADVIPDIVRAFDEPFGNSSVMPAYFCAHMAKKDVGLLLAGDGGDELFGGNKRYVEQKILGFYQSVPKAAKRVLEPVLGATPAAFSKTPFGKLQRYVARANLPMPERLHNPHVYGRDNLVNVFSEQALSALDIEQPYALWSQHYLDAESPDMLASMLHMDMRITIADNDIRKVNTACLLAHIDVRYPLLDDELISFANSLPSNLLIRGTRLRHFYKQAVRGFLPDAILNKPKHGFGMPFSEWTRDHDVLREIAADCLDGLLARGFFKDSFIHDVKEAHLGSGSSPYGDIVWDMMMLELWLRDRKPEII